jgi:hypothetical protein
MSGSCSIRKSEAGNCELRTPRPAALSTTNPDGGIAV